LGRKINDLIKVPLSKKILFDTIVPNTIIEIDYDQVEFKFNTLGQYLSATPTIDSNGYIVLDSVQS